MENQHTKLAVMIYFNPFVYKYHKLFLVVFFFKYKTNQLNITNMTSTSENRGKYALLSLLSLGAWIAFLLFLPAWSWVALPFLFTFIVQFFGWMQVFKNALKAPLRTVRNLFIIGFGHFFKDLCKYSLRLSPAELFYLLCKHL